ncbi:MAG: ATP-binding protein [Phycisphaerae bacterium]|nr:ATP-binding protein [Phycisphaerae bacterium]
MMEQEKHPMAATADMQPVADALFAYLRDAIYSPAKASLNVDELPEAFRTFGKGLAFFAHMVTEAKSLARELAEGNLHCGLPPPGNEVAAPLKKLHASLKHLTWQSQQVAKGDYQQRVAFMGDFSDAFNHMIEQLAERQQIILGEKSKLELYVNRLLANCPDPILMFDSSGCLGYASDSYLARRGVASIDTLLGQTANELFSPVVSGEFLLRLEQAFAEVVREKCTIELEQDIDFSGSGALRTYQIQVTAMLETDGGVGGVMVLLHDTTEIERARREAERARELAEQASRAKSEFLARMSHEMRTPMNAIIGMTYLYGTSHDECRHDACIKKIDEASKHLLGVINDILDMSKIEADNLELSESVFDFAAMIEQAAGVILFQVDERKQQFFSLIDPAIPAEIVADRQRLMQVLTNLLSNAVKFTPDEGEIALVVEKAHDEGDSCVIRFTVKDTGIGISPDQQARVFQSFEQADGGVARQYGGTGLGLPISKRIVEMMGGRIWVESEADKGASFLVEVPVKTVEPTPEATGDPEAATEEVSASDATAEGLFAGRRLLLADDVEINREIVLCMLEPTGIAIDMAEDGAEALAKFQASPDAYDLIFMDINMPTMDGYEATRQIRASASSEAATIPIIAMTANAFREDVDKCLASGMNAHLAKPVDFDAVIGTLKTYLRR